MLLLRSFKPRNRDWRWGWINGSSLYGFFPFIGLTFIAVLYVFFFQNIYFILETYLYRTSLVVQWLRLHAPNTGWARVRSLVRELRSRMQHGMAKRQDIKEEKKEKETCLLYYKGRGNSISEKVESSLK